MVLAQESIPLKTGEIVRLDLVLAPDETWARRLETLLQHKGEPWCWQNARLLRHETGLEARFFVLHREGAPLANLMLAEAGGVALLGHVWTEPADRGAGAGGLLLDYALREFATRGGRAVFLGTEAGSPAFHLYRRRGFEPISPGSGNMSRYFQSRTEFEQEWFDPASLHIEAMGWPHWPAAAPLCLAAHPGTVRIAAVGLIGPALNEGPFLALLREQDHRTRAGHGDPAATVLANPAGGVLGFASRMPDPLWPGREILDVHCHPSCWSHASALHDRLGPPRAPRCTAYSDLGHTEKQALLEGLGFRPATVLPAWVRDPAGRAADVTVWEKTT